MSPSLAHSASVSSIGQIARCPVSSLPRAVAFYRDTPDSIFCLKRPAWRSSIAAACGSC